ncbi:V-type ATP synthase subunit I [Treponema sp. R80B11-R83G3]
MKKICLLVQDKSHEESLKKLRAVGVVHLEKRNVPLDSNSSALKRKTKVEDAIGLIQDYKVPKKKPRDSKIDDGPLIERRQKPIGLHRGRRAEDIYGTDDESPYSIDAVKATPRPYLPDLMSKIGEERKQIKEKEAIIGREILRIEEWGNFDPSIIEEISKTLPVYLYEMPLDLFNRLDKDIQYIKIKSDKSIVRIMVFEKTVPSVTPFQLPQKSLSEYKDEIEKYNLELKEIDKELEHYADRRPALLKEMERVEYDLEFETAVAGLNKVEDIPSNQGLCWLTGYVPAEDLGLVKKIASENGWALSAEEPPETDEFVPTKLKNNKFVQLLTPITGFLDINPGYREVDVSPVFMTFFCIFFAMLFGDAAYGLIITTMALIGIIFALKNKKPVSIPIKMLLLLGLLNTLWGVLTCSWFAIDAKLLPDFLKKISLSYISSANPDQEIVSQNLQIFCFSLAVIHLVIAHIIVIFKCKSLKILGELGTIGMLLGMYNVVLFLIVSSDKRAIPLLPVSVYLIAGGFFLSFIFSSYNGSILKSILSSFQNIITVVLGVVNVFSDIMSYIRLWAVGLAGAAIAQTINGMAGPMLGSFLIFAGIILLIFGHGLNMVLNVLSVLVHGVRLNTLEFSGHVGLAWSGTAYRPFKEKKI